MNTYYLGIQGSYAHLELALFCNEKILESIWETDIKASSHLIPCLDTLLRNHRISLNDLACIAVDRGPGALTSLRVTIATVNGLSFASHVPLIGISGLEALAHQAYAAYSTDAPALDAIVSLLNAYHQDVYYVAYRCTPQREMVLETQPAYSSITAYCQTLATHYAGKHILFVGNGALLHQSILREHTGFVAHFLPETPLTASAVAIAQIGYNRWKAGEQSVTSIEPLYLKLQTYTSKLKS